MFYQLDLLKAEKATKKPDFEQTWENIQEGLKQARQEKADTSEFKNPLADLFNRFDIHFDLGELGELAFNLNIDLEKISSIEANKADIIVGMITHFQRRDRLDILIKAAHGLRPDIEEPFIEFLGVV